MAIQHEQRMENVRGSLFAYLNNNYSLTAIQWTRIPFEEKNNDAWITPTLLVRNRQFARQMGPNRIGAIVSYWLNININAKKVAAEGSNPYIITEIRDVLHELFKETTEIPIVDTTAGGGGNQIGKFVCFDLDERNLGEDENKSLYLYNFTVDGFYEEKFEPPGTVSLPS